MELLQKQHELTALKQMQEQQRIDEQFEQADREYNSKQLGNALPERTTQQTTGYKQYTLKDYKNMSHQS